MRLVSCCVLSVLLVACDGSGGIDGGVDAGADAGPPALDAGTDAGRRDGGPRDAGTDGGLVDGGPPTPMRVGLEVEANLSETLALRDAIPMDMRLDGAFMSLDIAASGIDALIGEEGLQTLSLSDETVRAFADLRQTNTAIAFLDNSIAGFASSADPAVIALRDSATVLRATLVRYRDALVTLYRDRLAAGIVGSPVVRETFTETQSTFGTGSATRLAFAAEGRSAGMPDAQLTVACGQPDMPMVRVFDETTGAMLAEGTSLEMVSLTIPLSYDTTTMLGVEIRGLIPAMSFPECQVLLATRRRLRTTPTPVSIDNAAFFQAALDYQSNLSSVASGLFFGGFGAFDPTVLEAAARAVTVLNDLVAPLLVDELVEVPAETLQRIRREHIYVAAMYRTAVDWVGMTADGKSVLPGEMSNLLPEADAMLTALP
jgi:hypothetical protein